MDLCAYMGSVERGYGDTGLRVIHEGIRGKL